MIAGKAAHLNILTQPRDRIVDDIDDFLVGIFNKRLFQQANFGLKLLHFALDNHLDDFFRLARLQRLLAIDNFFVLEFVG